MRLTKASSSTQSSSTQAPADTTSSPRGADSRSPRGRDSRSPLGRDSRPAGNSRFTSRRRPGSLAQKRDPKKEALLQELSTKLRHAGFTVRKEQLKRGHGWRAISGTCQALGEKLVFIDSRLNLDDQIAFLKGRVERELEQRGAGGEASETDGGVSNGRAVEADSTAS